MDRERITISIKKSLLGAIDKTIDGVVVRNRSHAIETLTQAALNNSEIEKAVILLGGKNAMENVSAAKEYITFLKTLGFNEIYIAVGFLADKIKEKIGFGEEFGLKISYLEKGEGSGGALLPLKKTLSTPFVVINAPLFIPLNYEKLLEYHKRFGMTATIATDDLSEMTGFYILDPKIFESIPKDFSMLETEIFPKLINKNQLIVFPLAN